VLSLKIEVWPYSAYHSLLKIYVLLQKGQLGRLPSPVDDSLGAVGGSVGGATRKAGSSKGVGEGPWYAVPGVIPLVGPHHGRRATWVGASGDLSFVKVDESLINATSLAASTVMANRNSVGKLSFSFYHKPFTVFFI
jgi:hypothetical protein